MYVFFALARTQEEEVQATTRLSRPVGAVEAEG